MSIDSSYNGVIEKLTKQGSVEYVSNKLKSLTRNDERVLYVYDVIEGLNDFPSALQVNKSHDVSRHYRNAGNSHFKSSRDHEAWQCYNLSLLFAPLETDTYTLALANRSAVFFSLQKYKECLQDIGEVFSMNYPVKLKDKLTKRQTACQEALNENENDLEENKNVISEILTLKEPRDTRYKCASTKLKVVYNDKMGRHVVAKEDIKVGDLLVQEDPYLTLLLKEQYLFCCSYCLSRNLNLTPCKTCCFALYCSTQCREKAWNEYHSVECTLMPTLVHMEFTKLELLALRTVIKAYHEYSDWSSLFKTMKEAEESVNSELWGHVKVNDEWIYDSKYYASIHTLATNVEVRTISDIFQKCVTAAVFLNLLSNNTDFFKVDDEISDEVRKCVAGTLLLHLMTSPTNMHGISTNIQTAEGYYINEISIASAPYAFLSLFNHSCSPNVVRLSKLGSGQMLLFALRPIKKGMQIFDNYGAHHALYDRQERQRVLKFQYKFTCLCEACINDWPTYLNMTHPSSMPKKLIQRKESILDTNAIEKLQEGDKSTAVKLFKPLCKLAEELEQYAPCKELADCQESLKQCLTIFGGVVPHGYSKLVNWLTTPPKEV